jgi:hypothetical protein
MADDDREWQRWLIEVILSSHANTGCGRINVTPRGMMCLACALAGSLIGERDESRRR